MLPSDWISRDRLWAHLVSNHTSGKTLHYLFKNTISHSAKIRLISTGLNTLFNTNKYRNTTRAAIPVTVLVIDIHKITFQQQTQSSMNKRFLSTAIENTTFPTVRLTLLRQRTQRIRESVIISAESSSDSHKTTQWVLNNTDSVLTNIQHCSSSNNNCFNHHG